MITASVLGAESVARGLGTLAARLSDLSPAFKQLGARMVETARPVTPFRSGALVRTLVARATGQGVSLQAGGGLAYGGVQNYGWPAHNIVGRHFLEAGGHEAETEGADVVESLLTATARRAGLI